MGSAWWQCTACLRAQEEDICELQLNHCNLYDVPPDVFIYERTLEKLYLDANRVIMNIGNCFMYPLTFLTFLYFTL